MVFLHVHWDYSIQVFSQSRRDGRKKEKSFSGYSEVEIPCHSVPGNYGDRNTRNGSIGRKGIILGNENAKNRIYLQKSKNQNRIIRHLGLHRRTNQNRSMIGLHFPLPLCYRQTLPLGLPYHPYPVVLVVGLIPGK